LTPVNFSSCFSSFGNVTFFGPRPRSSHRPDELDPAGLREGAHRLGALALLLASANVFTFT
jgi:hypothetical protein